MFLDKYLNSVYLDLVYDNYEDNYINSLDEDNFRKVYKLLKDNDFYFIEDIILKYLELFEFDVESVMFAIKCIREELGENYVKIIGKNMTIMDKILDMALSYEEKIIYRHFLEKDEKGLINSFSLIKYY